jgi:tetratricopeptide (TPR) repeat protein
VLALRDVSLPFPCRPAPPPPRGLKSLMRRVTLARARGTMASALTDSARTRIRVHSSAGGTLSVDAKDSDREDQDRPWEILFDAARFADGAGKYERAERRYQEALAGAEQSGAGDEMVAEILGELFELRRERHAAGAREIGERRLAILERLRGADHEEVGTLLTSLGCVVAGQGETKQGRELFRRGRRILEAALGARHPDIGRVLLEMAIVLRDAGREEDAEPLYRRALDILETAFGPDHLEVAEALEGLALCCDALGESERAERFYRRALSAFEHTLGSNSAPAAEVAQYLAELFMDDGEFELAAPLLRRALATLEEMGGPNSVAVAVCLERLADLYRGLQQPVLAVFQLRRALAIYEDDPEAVDSLGPLYERLAVVLEEAGQPDEARTARARADKLRRAGESS